LAHAEFPYDSEIPGDLRRSETLPQHRLEQPADYIHRLHSGSRRERKAALRRPAGSLTGEESGELSRIIEEGREQVDEGDW